MLILMPASNTGSHIWWASSSNSLGISRKNWILAAARETFVRPVAERFSPTVVRVTVVISSDDITKLFCTVWAVKSFSTTSSFKDATSVDPL